MSETRRSAGNILLTMHALVQTELEAGTRPEDMRIEVPFFTYVLLDAAGRIPYSVKGVQVDYSVHESERAFILWKRL